jgi:hypothetical protein
MTLMMILGLLLATLAAAGLMAWARPGFGQQ